MLPKLPLFKCHSGQENIFAMGSPLREVGKGQVSEALVCGVARQARARENAGDALFATAQALPGEGSPTSSVLVR